MFLKITTRAKIPYKHNLSDRVFLNVIKTELLVFFSNIRVMLQDDLKKKKNIIYINYVRNNKEN